MNTQFEFDFSPIAMEPLFPEDNSGKLETLSVLLIEKAAKLSGALNPITRNAIAELLRPMNSYYSNLIEGHDTHPIDIDRSLKKDFSENKAKRNLQIEACAHIEVHKKISTLFNNSTPIIPSSSSFIKELHKDFYEILPDDFKSVMSKEGVLKEVIAGEYRNCEVEVGKHIAPHSNNLRLFIEKFEKFYNPIDSTNSSKIKRIISIAASHHRLAWIHPFLDGNGRVIRLYSDACFMYENLHASGLWSISRGLSRNNNEYKSRLANADLLRLNDYDGRGNLSNKYLIEFCEFFLKVAIDQIDFMSQIINSEDMLKRISGFADLMVVKGRMKPKAKHLLIDVFLKGKISKKEAMERTNTSDKTLKLITDSLTEMELLIPKKESISMMYYVNFPIKFSPSFFPGLYPDNKEIDLLNKFG